MFLGWWRARRACKRSEEAQKAARIKDRAWSIFHEVAEPLVSGGHAKLSYPVTKDFQETDPPDEWIGLQPSNEKAAAVAVGCTGTAWIDLAVGEPFPVGSVYELDIERGWEEELRQCLDAVVEGRYKERVQKTRLGHREDMTFTLPSGERRIERTLITGPGFDRQPGEYRFESYRG